MNYVEFGNNFVGEDADTKSILRYGTIHLRLNPGNAAGLEGYGLIGVGHVESSGIDDTGDSLELPDESGGTESFLMVNLGTDVSLECRFTTNVPRPKKGWFFQILEPYASIDESTQNTTPGAFTSADVVRAYLITDVKIKYEEKGIRKCSITGRRWDSLDATDGAKSAVVNAATGAAPLGVRTLIPA